MAKFCGKCGTRLDEATGLCPNCTPVNVPQEEPRKEKTKKEKKAHKPLSRKTKVFLIISVVVVVLALVVGALFLLRDGGGYEVPRVDADAYYQEHATVIEKIPAEQSEEVLTESQAIQLFQDRGFVQEPIQTEYSMDGEYQEATDVSEGDTKHPKYFCHYITENGEYWTIVMLDGQIMATPVSYNLQSQRKATVVIAEDTVVTAYDSTTNTFFKIIPKETMMLVIKVDRVDAETLEQLTFEEIDGL